MDAMVCSDEVPGPTRGGATDAGLAGVAALAAGLMAGCASTAGGVGGSLRAGDIGSLSEAELKRQVEKAELAIGASHRKPASDEDAARFLLQAQLSATPQEIAEVRRDGYLLALVRRMAVPIEQTGWDWLESRGYGFASVRDPAEYYNSVTPATDMAWAQLITAPDGVRKRVALALSEFMVVSLNGLDLQWRSHHAAHYWDILNQHAFGNFRDLLQDVTLSVAMGHYLNTRGNQKADASGRQPDENYAREVMQLFTIGLLALNLDGTPQLVGGQPVECYGPDDVSQLARVFTGFDSDFRPSDASVKLDNGQRTVRDTQSTRRPMKLNQNRNSTIGARFLGTTIAPGESRAGMSALNVALDTLFKHPNVGPFFGKQMIQRLVTSNPSPAYVQRVATVFNNNGQGTRGDLSAVFAAILLDDEARGPAGLEPAASFGKLREPMLRFVQWARTFGFNSTSGRWRVGDLSNPATQLGQSPLRSPSVFNFFRPGYVPPGTGIASAHEVAPEFQIVNESSVGGYINFMRNVQVNGLFNTGTGADMTASFEPVMDLALNASDLVERISLLMSAGQLRAPTKARIVRALNATPLNASSTVDQRRNRLRAAVLLVMASPEYLVQK